MATRLPPATLALAAVLAAGCALDDGPALVEPTEVAPRELERGDRLEVAGRGFPEGKPAHVVLRGALLRPGRRPEHDVEIDVAALASAPGRVAAAVDDALEASVCGAGDRAAPTTFEGDVVVVFPGATASSLPIAGALRATRLDFRCPPPRRATAATLDAEGARWLAFVGIVPADDAPAGGGVTIAAVRAKSPAEAAGLAPGDVVTRSDGVRVRSRADLAPSGAAEVATLSVRRLDALPGDADATRVVSLRGLSSGGGDLSGSAVVLGALAALLLLLQPPWARALAWVERRALDRLRARSSRARGGRGLAASVAGVVRALLAEEVTAGDPDPTLARASFFVMSALVAALPLAHARLGAEPDAIVPFAFGASALAIAAALTASGASGASGAWTIVGALREARDVLCLELPGAIALATALVATGGLRIDDAVRQQGGAPWRWLALQAPGGLVLVAAWLATGLADPSDATSPLASAADAGGARPVGPPRRAFVLLADGARGFVACALAAALWLGGWELPGVAPHAVDARLSLECAGAALYLAKTWALFLGVRAARQALPRVDVKAAARASVLATLPLAAIAAATAALHARLVPDAAARASVGAATALALCGLAAHLALRVRASLLAPTLPARVSPLV